MNIYKNISQILNDLHSGNILLIDHECQIGDLGLSQPANNPLNNDIYGVVPYIAPEIFLDASFSKASDIYSLGMIMWESTTGCKPFANVEHNIDLIIEIIDGKRPKITKDTPECFANLMKRCWDSDPLKRPSITDICKYINDWCCKKENDKFNQAEVKRLELIELKKLGPDFTEKSHQNSVYASKTLNSLISLSLSMNSIINSRNMKMEHLNLIYNFMSRKRNIEVLNVKVTNQKVYEN
ncbi:8464_t:CDS:2 [Funneliformis geosporum]|nr:8464_t:CDS:2 [Funneliformis geosporum]